MNTQLQENHYDVAIVGGGPAGSTAGTFLRKYNPNLRVLILEKEKFPRDHVGESQLPAISDILVEMGCWDKVEAANFPIKIGATYRWGKSSELWDFDFVSSSEFKNEPRPAQYRGQRILTAFQVDRAIYDDILLRHAEELGCEVREETAVAKVDVEGDQINSLHLSNGKQITARYYIDASGHIGVLRRALGIKSDIPTKLQNIAIWDYWTNAEWADTIGVGGTRVQVMSLAHGWIWFIPLGPTRTSIGFICPAEHYKKLKKRPEEIYQEALQSEPRIGELIANATSRGNIETTKDWSFLSQRMVGENWFMAGEAAGFADPILAAGMTLTHVSAREAAYTILELERGKSNPTWLKTHYEDNQRRRIQQHIRFADYWYAANGQFTDLQKHCKEIAKDAGLRLSPEEAFRWLAQGGFTNDNLQETAIGGFDLASMKHVLQRFAKKKSAWEISGYNVFQLDLKGAKEEYLPLYAQGHIAQVKCYVRKNHQLPITGIYGVIFRVLNRASEMDEIVKLLKEAFSVSVPPEHIPLAMDQGIQCLEVMVSEGWVKAQVNRKKTKLQISIPDEGKLIHTHHG
ncbi:MULTISPECIES: NAD(P)/FAD-dependent oxidoreductase [unclassified Okeania]|uniref:NAD(P)/FAD-dependent oxidoreductase n=1 Tax=unclassified Okeania TaxID=2634635 RepID=UPI0013B682C2|nr:MULTISPECIES: NAD(P)/FAD-dependent oxidoreductase [unclassified Okeania]NES78546.1 NAD(P)/FAD-dependent oxidoreductase [Okeania sp. SIO1H4]NET14117.1 NAD(P)/FAD-dependent oxidoreductase [Okeania sp. SIO1H6]NET21917.1 NAD(P)/FAD-dependent oxidoreductase [Okeania sp. SIO1H5]NET95122.1 NAD(P)/FAD-dependent oxidoreductase [Okeania sp. SIO1H2]